MLVTEQTVKSPGKVGARRADVRGPQDLPKLARVRIDWLVVGRLAQLQSPVSEISWILGVSESSLRRAAMRDLKQPLQDYVGTNRSIGHLALRKKQWQLAMQGSVRMLIHLGKVYLNQNRSCLTKLSAQNASTVVKLHDLSPDIRERVLAAIR